MATLQLRHYQIIVLTIQEGTNIVSVNTYSEQRKMLSMFSVTFTYSCQTISKARNSFVNWTCGKLLHIFSSETSEFRNCLGFVCLSPDMISAWHSNLES